jgi:hypothetical protein
MWFGSRGLVEDLAWDRALLLKENGKTSGFCNRPLIPIAEE